MRRPGIFMVMEKLNKQVREMYGKDLMVPYILWIDGDLYQLWLKEMRKLYQAPFEEGIDEWDFGYGRVKIKILYPDGKLNHQIYLFGKTGYGVGDMLKEFNIIE